MPSRPRSLPANVTDRTLALWSCDEDDEGWQTTAVGPDLASVPLERARPAREFASWPGKRNYEGLWWSSTTRTHVGFESLLERDALLWFDWDPDVVSISSQPLAFLWPKGRPGHKSHVPDYFVRLRNGDGKLVDVRGEAHQDAKALAQFAMTREVCDGVGWQYEVFPCLPEGLAESLRWLAGYRQDRCAPSPETRDRILAAYEHGAALGEGVDRVARFAAVPAEIVLANVYHLLWARILSPDLGSPLSMATRVVAS